MLTTSREGFYVGDPCYALSDDDYHGAWGKNYNYDSGEIEIRGHKALIHHTCYGDGCYYDNNGHRYPVDSGTLAVIPLEIIDRNSPDIQWGRIIKGSGRAFLDYEENGMFEIQLPGEEFRICTGYEEEESVGPEFFGY